MCLILVAWRVHPAYRLVVAANRDEFFARPTAAAAFWADHPDILAGRDLQDGGTWLGVSRRNRFAALTNYRDPGHHLAGRPSRGRLVADFLGSALSPDEWLDAATADAARYNGFNLLLGDGRILHWFSNVTGERRELAPGIYGVSNHLLDTPWPKVQAAKSGLSAALAALPDEIQLLELLRDDRPHPEETLPRTGVSLEWERLLSSAFVRAPDYGTRSSTLVMIDAAGKAIVDEQTWLEGGRPGDRLRYRFTVAAPDA
jgi:uncharacterized protein with NRDE domain